jgi:hypothetical protein
MHELICRVMYAAVGLQGPRSNGETRRISPLILSYVGRGAAEMPFQEWFKFLNAVAIG